jgi:hypothetical protein
MAQRAAPELTDRDQEILSTLTHRVRILSVAQVARTWWQGTRRPVENAAARLRALDRGGLLAAFEIVAHPEIELAGPVARWQPGEEAPDFGAVSYRLRARWTEPVRTTSVIAATAAGAALVGGVGGRRPRPSETTHDLHLAAVYLRVCAFSPALARSWRSEALLYSAGGGRDEKLPDATLSDGHRTLVVEFGGAYRKPKLIEFHEHCAERSLPYQIW